MITDPDDFKQSRSAYERPNFKYRCGREIIWGKPCHQGPNADGACGGTSECNPAKNKNGRFECRRPPNAGGPCPDGPRPDGSCSITHPPCAPRLTLRAWHARLTLFAICMPVAFIGGLLVFDPASSMTLNPLNPGPLSAKHSNFTREGQCVFCHAAHNQGAVGWIKAVFTRQDISNQCMTCHTFAGADNKAHNMNFPERTAMLEPTQCVMCHTEHKGVGSNIIRMNDAQCNACHIQKFESFSKGHPPFSKSFPYDQRTAIRFDHAAHFNKYFKNPANAKIAPQACTACHFIEGNLQRDMKTRSFENNCMGCHGAEIAKADFVFFRLPEFTANTIKPEEVAAACGAPPASPSTPASAASTAFESVSTDQPTRIITYLLGVDGKEPDAYGPVMQKLLLDMAQNGIEPLAKMIDAKAGTGMSQKLLQGLSPELVKKVACSWIANQEYEAPETISLGGGWYANALALRYKPTGHADPVVKNWIDFGMNIANQASEGKSKSDAEAIVETLTSRTTGGGHCTKCHAVSESLPDHKKLSVEWSLRKFESMPFTFFSHGAHIDPLGGSRACATCHVMNLDAKYGSSFDTFDPGKFVSNFHPIQKEACVQCHAGESSGEQVPFQESYERLGAGAYAMGSKDSKTKGQVRQDCLLCHIYHLGPGLKQTVGANFQAQENRQSAENIQTK